MVTSVQFDQATPTLDSSAHAYRGDCDVGTQLQVQEVESLEAKRRIEWLAVAARVTLENLDASGPCVMLATVEEGTPDTSADPLRRYCEVPNMATPGSVDDLPGSSRDQPPQPIASPAISAR